MNYRSPRPPQRVPPAWSRRGWAPRWLGRLGLMALLPLVLLMASLSLPVKRWRTGERPVPPLPLTAGGPAVRLPPRVWVDTDAACGVGGATDSDDCLAVLALLASTDLNVVGISSVAGNASAEITHRTAAALLARVPRPPPLYRGGAAGGGAASEAVTALRGALAEGPLTIVALGPLTNVAAALRDHSALQHHVARLVAVMGRRRGHLFHPSEGVGAGVLFGHGPIFTDFNVRQDPTAAEAVFRMGLPVTLVPYDVARTIRIDDADLRRLDSAGGAAAWAADGSRDWLRFWKDVVGLPGFYPFDLLAAAYVLDPARFSCALAPTWVAPAEDWLGSLYSPVSVLVGVADERPDDVLAATRTVYCPIVDPSVHRMLVRQLASAGLNRHDNRP